MDVVVWLRSLGLGKYEAAFRENEIDETVLPNLTADVPGWVELAVKATVGSLLRPVTVLNPLMRAGSLGVAAGPPKRGLGTGVPTMLPFGSRTSTNVPGPTTPRLAWSDALDERR